MLRIEIRTSHNSVTLLCSGRLVLGVEAETLRCMATSRAEECVVLDLSNIKTIDATGLGLLVELHSWAYDHDKLLRILNPSAWVCRLLHLTNLESLLHVTSCADFRAGDVRGRSGSWGFARRARMA